MKRRTALLLTMALVATGLAACGNSAEVTDGGASSVIIDDSSSEVPLSDSSDDLETDNVDWQDYKSDKGWAVVYDANLIKVEESSENKGEIQFIYTGEAEGTNIVTANWKEGILPDEEIEELKKTAEEDAETDISGGFFPGTSDKWAYWCTIVPMKKGSGNTRTYILGEYNGGTLEFMCSTSKSGDEETDMIISDSLALIIDSLTFEDFKPQTMYENYPGTYTQQIKEELDGEEYTFDYSVTLNEDHTGVLSIQDEMKVYWDDRAMMTQDGDNKYFFKLDGDTLTIDFDGMDSVFTRE